MQISLKSQALVRSLNAGIHTETLDAKRFPDTKISEITNQFSLHISVIKEIADCFNDKQNYGKIYKYALKMVIWGKCKQRQNV